MVNILKLEEVRARIVEYSENFNYEFILARKDTTRYDPRPDHERLKDMLKHECGTCGCVAGFTICDLDAKELRYDRIGQAKEILGLNYDEYRFLFFAANPYKGDDDAKYIEYYDHLANFNIGTCTQDEGRVEALKRIDFILDHYRSIANALAS